METFFQDIRFGARTLLTKGLYGHQQAVSMLKGSSRRIGFACLSPISTINFLRS